MLVLAPLAALLTVSLPVAESTNPPAPPKAPDLAPLAFWGDYDKDGRADIYAIYPAGDDRLFRNEGDGSFDDVTAASGLSHVRGSRAALWADVDRDGDLDLYLVSSRADRRLFVNQGQAGFMDATLEAGLQRAGEDLLGTWVDYDGDARPDLMLRTTAGDLLFHNLAGTSFEQVPLGIPGAVGAAPGAAASPTGVAGGPMSGGATQPGVAGGGPSPSWSPFTVPWAPGLTQGLDLTGRALPSGAAPTPLGCAPGIADQAVPSSCIQASTVPALGQLYPMSTTLNVDTSGRVGVGTSSQATQLDVRDSGTPGTARTILTLRTAESVTGSEGRLDWAQSGAVTGRIANANEGVYGLGMSFSTYDGGLFERMRINAGGKVGLGTTNPLERLHLAAIAGSDTRFLLDAPATGPNSCAFDFAIGGAVKAFFLVDNGAGAQGMNVGDLMLRLVNQRFFISVDNGASTALLVDASGNVGIGTTSPQEALDVNGSTRQQCVKITGGCDIVEGFETGGQVLEPGTVVVIDPQRPGEMKVSTEPYDSKVAGVVSGAGGVNPGISLSQEGVLDGATKVAMAGRVWVKCSAENGAIQPGDRLTTAGTPGHAMKVTDDTLGIGAVIGKAMTRLDADRGLVLVLVNLQ